MKLQVEIQVACGEPVPEETDIRQWIAAALDKTTPGRRAAEVVVRLVGEPEMLRLNRRYRGRNSATNVLAFPWDPPSEAKSALLGDIVICAGVVAGEAAQQGKALAAHWCHLLVHGCLHLLGYEHGKASAARAMESMEREILGSLGFPCPYSGAGL
ncbi:MAG: rRNA maturation RNase YbeY [Halieaceae bacterium]|nr:rRNA maturation RNase YbeY [Halieaceae bacterium]